MKLFLLINTLLLQLYLPDFIWFSSFQILVLWLYFNAENMQLEKVSLQKIKFNEKWFLFGSFILALAIRLIWLLNTENNGTVDSGLRLLYAKEWIDVISNQNSIIQNINSYFFMPSTSWLPLHQYIIGTTSVITGDWIYTPRVVTVLFGSLTIIPLFKLSVMKFDKTTAIISSLLITFYGYHIFLSSQTTSEVIYVFLIVYIYYFIEKWELVKKGKYIYLISFFVVFISLLRYEGWIFSFLILIFILITNKFRVKVALILMLSLLIPILFVAINMLSYGLHPLHGILYSDYFNVYLYKMPKSISLFMSEYIKSYILLTATAIILYLIRIVKDKDYSQLIKLAIYLIPLMPFLYKSFNGTLLAQARYLVIYMIPLIPFVAYFIANILKSLTNPMKIFLITFFIFATNFPFISSLTDYTGTYSKGFFQSSKYVKEIKKGHFFIDSYNSSGWENWLVYSDVFYGEYRLNMVKLKDKLEKLYTKIRDNQKSDEIKRLIYISDKRKLTADLLHEDLNRLIKKDTITHIVLFPNGLLNEKLKLNENIEHINEVRFEKIYDLDGFLIYSKHP